MFKNWFLYVPLKTHGPTVSLTLFLTCRVLARLDRISPVSIPSKTVRRNATPTGDLAQWQLQSLVVRSSEQQRVVPGEADAPHRSAVHLAGFRRFRSFRRPTGPFLDRKQHVPSRSRQRLTKPSTIERFRIPGAAARVRWNSTGPTWANSTDHRSLPLPLPLLSLSLSVGRSSTRLFGAGPGAGDAGGSRFPTETTIREAKQEAKLPRNDAGVRFIQSISRFCPNQRHWDH